MLGWAHNSIEMNQLTNKNWTLVIYTILGHLYSEKVGVLSKYCPL